MSTPLSEIYNVFLTQIDDDILAMLEREVADNMLLVYLKGATVHFNECKKDLKIVEPDLNTGVKGHIVGDLDIDEIFILSKGMIKYWLQPKILREDNLKSMLTDGDYNQKSPANMLDKLIKLKEVSDRELEQDKINYSYKNFEGWD